MNRGASSIVKRSTSKNEEIGTADTLAHEIGHLLGIDHDFETSKNRKYTCNDTKGMMDHYGDIYKTKGWSNCSNLDFKNYFEKITRQSDFCLKPSLSPKIACPCNVMEVYQKEKNHTDFEYLKPLLGKYKKQTEIIHGRNYYKNNNFGIWYDDAHNVWFIGMDKYRGFYKGFAYIQKYDPCPSGNSGNNNSSWMIIKRYVGQPEADGSRYWKARWEETEKYLDVRCLDV